MKLVYLCGTIAGDPDSLGKFNGHERALRDAGYGVLNPRRHGDAGARSWLDYMRLGIADLVVCDEVALIPGWESGVGTVVEVDLARSLGIPAHPVDFYGVDA